jgi:hypothetical protein
LIPVGIVRRRGRRGRKRTAVLKQIRKAKGVREDEGEWGEGIKSKLTNGGYAAGGGAQRTARPTGEPGAHGVTRRTLKGLGVRLRLGLRILAPRTVNFRHSRLGGRGAGRCP